MNDPLNIQSTPGIQPGARSTASPPKTPAGGPSFADILSQTQAQKLRFSNHAQKRLDTRQINLTDDGLNRLTHAVDKAEKRGGKESLVMVDDMAFIVNVKDRLVVTAIDAKSRGDGVFTQIDSVVFADPASAGTVKKA
jgi:flagellar operon protein